MNFAAKLNRAIANNNSLLIVGLDPNPEMLPDNYRTAEADNIIASLESWLLWVIKSTQQNVCAYKPTLGFYQALGGPGLRLARKSNRRDSPSNSRYSRC